MQAPYLPARAAEFPNDNPALHQGARWVCRSTSEPARAWVNARHLPANASLSAAPPDVSGVPAVNVVSRAALEALVRDCKGPLVLDLSRLVSAQRVEDVPPPPEFVFRPFVPSPSLPLSPASAVPLTPLPCRVIDERETTRRVDRRWRVDVAPCLSIESPAAAVPSLPEQPSRRRRRVPAHGGPRSVALPNLMDLNRAISELEAAFAERPISADSLAARPALLTRAPLATSPIGSLPLSEAAGGTL